MVMGCMESSQRSSDEGGRRCSLESEPETVQHGEVVPHRLSRREFLFSAAGIMLGGVAWPSLGDDLLTARDYAHGYIAPERGEELPSDRSSVAKQPEVAGSPPNARDLYLTFDDGPLFCTGEILDILADAGHKATFFVIGGNLANPKLKRLAIRALEEGHDLGNHSYSHPSFSSLSADRAAREILTTHKLIEQLVKEAGVDPERQNLFFRFPFGDGGNAWNYRTIQNTLDNLGYGVAWWDLDTNDWRMELQWLPRSPSRVIASIKRARPRDVVLLHDRSTTAKYLPNMLEVVHALELVSTTLSDVELGSRVHVTRNELDQILKPLDSPQSGSSDSNSDDVLDALMPWKHLPSGEERTGPGGRQGGLSNMW